MNGEKMDEIKRARLEAELNELKERRQHYLAQERRMLTGGAQAYGIGSRNLTRYSVDLGNIRAALKELDEAIKEIESQIDGNAKRKRVGMVFREW